MHSWKIDRGSDTYSVFKLRSSSAGFLINKSHLKIVARWKAVMSRVRKINVCNRYLTLTEVKLWAVGIKIYYIAVLLLVSIEIPRLLTEYKIDGIRRFILNVVLSLSGLLSLTVDQTFYLYSHISSPESSNEAVCKSTSVCTSNATLHHREEHFHWCVHRRTCTQE